MCGLKARCIPDISSTSGVARPLCVCVCVEQGSIEHPTASNLDSECLNLCNGLLLSKETDITRISG